MTEYQDELKIRPHPRSIDAIKALALLRGAAIGVDYAEAFEIQYQKEL